MGIIVKAESEVALVGIKVASVYCELLNLDGLEEEQLLQSVVNRLFLEEFLKLCFQVTQVVGLKLHSQL